MLYYMMNMYFSMAFFLNKNDFLRFYPFLLKKKNVFIKNIKNAFVNLLTAYRLLHESVNQ